MTSVKCALETGYTPSTRPVSILELSHSRNTLASSLRLSNVRATHKRCKHWYRVRTNGKKHKQISETGSCETGNCSVCWRINTTPKNLKNAAMNLSAEYMKTWEDPSKNSWNHYETTLEKAFYDWLYSQSEK